MYTNVNFLPQEVAPLLLLCLQASICSEQRAELLQLLFWMSKRPDSKQRAAIVTTLLLLMVNRNTSVFTDGVGSVGSSSHRTSGEDESEQDINSVLTDDLGNDHLGPGNLTDEVKGKSQELGRVALPAGVNTEEVPECNLDVDTEDDDANLTGEEVLPFCRQLVESKFPEQRLLGVECIVVLTLQSIAHLDSPAPRSIPPECLVDILLQCLEEEKALDVREAMLSCLALLLCLPLNENRIVSISEAFSICLEEHGWCVQENSSNEQIANNSSLSNKFLSNDPNVCTNTGGISLLHMALGQKHYDSNNKTITIDVLLSTLLERLKNYMCSCENICEGSSEDAKNHVLYKIPAEDLLRVASLVKAIDKLLPYLLASMMSTAPSPERSEKLSFPTSVKWIIEKLEQIIGDDHEYADYCSLRRTLVQEWFKSWPLFDYLTKELMPFLVNTLAHFDASESEVVQAFIHLFHDWAVCLGDTATAIHICPLFHQQLSMAESDLERIRDGSTSLTRAPLVVFTFSILGSQYHHHQMLLLESSGQVNSSSAYLANNNDPTTASSPLQEFLTRHISIVCLCGGSLTAVEHSMTALLSALPLTREPVLAVLWACLVNKSATVRAASAGLWTIAAGEHRVLHACTL